MKSNQTQNNAADKHSIMPSCVTDPFQFRTRRRLPDLVGLEKDHDKYRSMLTDEKASASLLLQEDQK